MVAIAPSLTLADLIAFRDKMLDIECTRIAEGRTEFIMTTDGFLWVTPQELENYDIIE